MHWDDIPPVVNYLRVRAPDHPLASARGLVALHRWLVYRRLGDGPHPCHWCGTSVTWMLGGVRRGALVVDHIDRNQGNNDETNLVPSCVGCNAWREHGGVLTLDEPTVQLASGRSRAVEQVCAWCDKTYLTRRIRAGVQRFCSHQCRASWARRQPEMAAKMGAIIMDDEPHIIRRSRDGAVVARLRGIPRTCRQCGATSVVTPQHRKGGTGSLRCRACADTLAGAHGNHRRGDAHQHAKLTEADVREMRRLWAAGGITLQALGARFGVTKSGANMVVYRRCWTHI
jgi:hypothetical protein